MRVLYLFGAFLVFTGIKMWILADHVPDIAGNPLLKFLRKHMRVTDGLHDNAFWVNKPHLVSGKAVRWATPLLLAQVMIEFVDLVIAVDSVPAIFGLRALYFALAAMIHRFKHLKYALALVLVFIGTKIFLVGFIGKFPPAFSLTVTFGLIAGGVLVSLWKTRSQAVAANAP